MIRPETLALLDNFLSTERAVGELLEQMRELVCDMVWAGDDLHTTHHEEATAEQRQFHEAWQLCGGQKVLDAFDHLSAQIEDEVGK